MASLTDQRYATLRPGVVTFDLHDTELLLYFVLFCNCFSISATATKDSRP